MIENQSNWAGNYSYSADRLHYPETVEQVQEVVGRADKLKVLGSRHSFNSIADSPRGDLISLDRLPRLLLLDRDRRSVTVDGGARYGELSRQLHLEGYALRNLASLPHISVAGACATATHGSGNRNGNLATSVSAIELVTSQGTVVVLSRDQEQHDKQSGKQGEQLAGAVVGLGGPGVVTKLTLDIVPAFTMRQDVYEDLPLDQLEKHFDEIVSSAYSVSLITDWQRENVSQVWMKRPVTEGAAFELEPDLFGAKLATTRLHPIPGISAEACTEQMGVPGPWYDRLPHFRIDFTPSSGEELQSEYLLPRHHAISALRAIYGLRDRLAPLLQISEVRTVAADNLWMSPCYGQACVAIHFTWKKEWRAVRQLLPLIEEQLAPYDARPHWGKLFTMPPARVQSLYTRLPDFRQLLCSYDPEGKFRNPFLDSYVF
ncbi:MAG: FAD-binding protein [Chloroflexota bacterium]|nr:FAD-binding protein [Chloroflexota bacterium]